MYHDYTTDYDYDDELELPEFHTKRAEYEELLPFHKEKKFWTVRMTPVYQTRTCVYPEVKVAYGERRPKLDLLMQDLTDGETVTILRRRMLLGIPAEQAEEFIALVSKLNITLVGMTVEELRKNIREKAHHTRTTGIRCTTGTSARVGAPGTAERDTAASLLMQGKSAKDIIAMGLLKKSQAYDLAKLVKSGQYTPSQQAVAPTVPAEYICTTRKELHVVQEALGALRTINRAEWVSPERKMETLRKWVKEQKCPKVLDVLQYTDLQSELAEMKDTLELMAAPMADSLATEFDVRMELMLADFGITEEDIHEAAMQAEADMQVDDADTAEIEQALDMIVVPDLTPENQQILRTTRKKLQREWYDSVRGQMDDEEVMAAATAVRDSKLELAELELWSAQKFR